MRASFASIVLSLVLACVSARAETRAWTRLNAEPFERRPCALQRYDASALDVKTFDDYFRASGVPVVVRGLTPLRARTLERVRREKLLEALGDEFVTLSSSNTHSRGRRRKTLRAYVEEDVRMSQRGSTDATETWYWFGEHVEEGGEMSRGLKEILETYENLPYVPRDADVAYSFGVGGGFSGVPFHTHGPGWSESLIGRKHWFLSAPSATPRFDPNVTTYEWALDALKRGELHEGGAILECTVNEGEAIYFPPNWWHATLNLDESVFISSFVNYKSDARWEEL